MRDLIDFLLNKMSMTDVYQPAVIKELLVKGGKETKANLARILIQYDVSVIEYYQKIVMRWPKTTLLKHGVVEYDRKQQLFKLLLMPEDESTRLQAIQICEKRISGWLESKSQRRNSPEPIASVRYLVLKSANRKCQLCGIPAALRPIDVDHIIPRAKANKNNKILKDGVWIDVDSMENLQALCFKCNRAKRDADVTDFRQTKKLVRDNIPDIIRAEGRWPLFKKLIGNQLTHALHDKLVEEHAEFIAETDCEKKMEELADMLEVIFAIARQHGLPESELMDIVRSKRTSKGGLVHGYYYLGEGSEIAEQAIEHEC